MTITTTAPKSPTWYYRVERRTGDTREPVDEHRYRSDHQLTEAECTELLQGCDLSGEIRLFEEIIHNQVRAVRRG